MTTMVNRFQYRLKKIDSSPIFQWSVIAVIIISALLIGAKTHDLPEPVVNLLFLIKNWELVLNFFIRS